MNKFYVDKKYKFYEVFNTATGAYIRSGVHNEQGEDTNVDPFMRSFPSLIDIGLMGGCVHGKTGLCAKSGVQCYQNGLATCEPNMTLDNFKKIIDEGEKKGLFQCLHENEVVIVRNPFTRLAHSIYIRDIKVGDEIYTGDPGKPFAKVVEVHKSVEDGFKINLPAGKQIIATAKHRFPLDNGELKFTKDLKVGDIIKQTPLTTESIETIDVVRNIIANGGGDFFTISGKEIKEKYGKYSVSVSAIANDINQLPYNYCDISLKNNFHKISPFLAVSDGLALYAGYYLRTINEKKIPDYTTDVVSSFMDFALGCRSIGGEVQLPTFLFGASKKTCMLFLRSFLPESSFDGFVDNILEGSIDFRKAPKKLAYDLTLLMHRFNTGYGFEPHRGKKASHDAKTMVIRNNRMTYRATLAIQSVEPVGKINVVDINIDTQNHLFMTTHGVLTHNCALGGRGDPDMHEEFEEVIKYSASRNITPNFTTSGLGMTTEKAMLCKKYCGAVAVSMYSRLESTTPTVAIRKLGGEEEGRVYRSVEDIPVKFTFGNEIDRNCYWDAPNYIINGKTYEWDELHHINFGTKPQRYELRLVYDEKQEPNYTMKAIKMLLDAKVKTNIHYVLSNSSIDKAIIRLKYNGFPKGINAVIFLLHKPVGLGKQDNVLQYNDPRLAEFFKIIDNKQFPFKIGFDSCTVPGILNLTSNIAQESIDSCEGGRFSMYITSDMKALPCSFDNQEMRWAVDLNHATIEEAWNSIAFDDFRNHFKGSCKGCSKRHLCYGGCPIRREIVLCNSKDKNLYTAPIAEYTRINENK